MTGNRQNETCWWLVEAAASNEPGAREDFARNYAPVVRAYLCHRWRRSRHIASVDDAVQELFVECFRSGGMLEKVDATRAGGFRAFLYGAARNIALRFETRQARSRELQAASRFDPDGVVRDETTLSQVFDRSWLESRLRQAAEEQRRGAEERGEDAVRRVELLQLRFHDELPFGEIARRWGVDVKWLYREAARAREEFREALHKIVSLHKPGSQAEVERECEQLLSLLR